MCSSIFDEDDNSRLECPVCGEHYPIDYNEGFCENCPIEDQEELLVVKGEDEDGNNIYEDSDIDADSVDFDKEDLLDSI